MSVRIRAEIEENAVLYSATCRPDIGEPCVFSNSVTLLSSTTHLSMYRGPNSLYLFNFHERWNTANYPTMREFMRAPSPTPRRRRVFLRIHGGKTISWLIFLLLYETADSRSVTVCVTSSD